MVEVQVRTALQAYWAELYERMADQWGRQIRYGGQADPGRPLTSHRAVAGRWELVGEVTRESTVSSMEQLATAIGVTERARQHIMDTKQSIDETVALLHRQLQGMALVEQALSNVERPSEAKEEAK